MEQYVHTGVTIAVGFKKIVIRPYPVKGLDSGVWLVEEGLPERWAGWGRPNSVISARIGSLYQRLDPGGASSLWVKQAADGQNIGWVEVGKLNELP